MRLSRRLKIILGVVTLWPFIYVVIAFAGMLTTALFLGLGETQPTRMPLPVILMIVGHLITMFIIIALITFYVVYLFTTDRIRQDKKALWAVVLFLGHILAMPVFFVLYVWPEESGNGTPAGPGADLRSPTLPDTTDTRP